MADARTLTIKTELDTDPLVRGYAAMTDQQAADSLNTIDRPVEATAESILNFMRTNKNRTNVGANPGDLVSTFILGRLELVAGGAAGDNPFDATPAFNLTQKWITSAKTMLNILGVGTGLATDIITINFDEILDDLNDSGVIGALDKVAILALQANQQSRGNELGVGRVGVGSVTEARGLQ